MAISTLRLLSNLIAEAVDAIEGTYTEAGVPLPRLDDPSPYDPTDPAEALRGHPVVEAATINLVAAAAQITATARHPILSALVDAHAFQISSCLRTASELNVVEILRESGPQGLHANDIAVQSHADPGLLARILRLLATHHIFQEVAPGVFANNRISSTLDKGKPAALLFERREDRLTDTAGIAAMVEFLGDDCFKSSAQLGDALLDPTGEQRPLARAMRTVEPMFQWFTRPENRYRGTRFGLAMHGSANAEPEGFLFKGYDWGSLPADAVVVDVGGGIGTTSMAIARNYPAFKVIVQDLPPTIEDAKAHWNQHFPEHVQSKMVELQGQFFSSVYRCHRFDFIPAHQVHNFFGPQPMQNADVFMLRHIIHDWPDEKSIAILKHLREAAKPTTQLIIIENIIPVVSEGESDDPKINSVPGAMRKAAPAPLLPNFGVSNASMYLFDLTVHNMLGGVERTVRGFYDLLNESGWELVRVYRCPGSEKCHIVGVPK
ncbi:O-methyltransferase [Mycena pura]|uniref:O-methyltransferase n=1 Tax=Mycena pura TaxID=153505 RepID=A0AAD6V1Z6_9AGAR|nr:O-methyltransferase [Mycena pura]